MKDASTLCCLVFCCLISLIACRAENSVSTDDATRTDETTDPTGSTVQRAKFEPPDGQILVFAGQSNDAVGGHGDYDSGYVDHFGVPSGVSHYVGYLGQVTTALGFEFEDGRIEGLSRWDYWGAGPMCLKCYLDDPDFAGTIVHLGIAMTDGSAARIAKGEPDSDLDELAAFLKTYSAFPFLLRIGYEFDGSWNAYEPETYKAAFTHTVDSLRQAGVTNFATVFAASSPFIPRDTWEAFYPGDDSVDWLGYSWWGPPIQDETSTNDEFPPKSVAAELAREWQKPLLMAEVGPRHYRLGKDDTEHAWAWYQSLFAHIEDHSDVIHGLAIINNHWDPEPMWKDGDWGDFRLENDAEIAKRWRETMAEPRFVHRTEGLYPLIQFESVRSGP